MARERSERARSTSAERLLLKKCLMEGAWKWRETKDTQMPGETSKCLKIYLLNALCSKCLFSFFPWPCWTLSPSQNGEQNKRLRGAASISFFFPSHNSSLAGYSYSYCCGCLLAAAAAAAVVALWPAVTAAAAAAAVCSCCFSAGSASSLSY